MVFFCGFVVGFCGLDFVFEVSESDGFAIGCDFSNELLFARIEAYAFILRACIFSFLRISIVLGAACGAKVRLSIIEAVMVDVVNDAAGRNFYYTAVHVNGARVFSGGSVSLGVKCVAVLRNMPSVFT